MADRDKNNDGAGPESSMELSMLRQGWASIVIWMAMGLLMEGLLGYKAPDYLSDPQRRELFRLAHSHGNLLGLILIASAWTARRYGFPPRLAQIALQIGAAMMPVGFLLAGIWHREGDPGPAIWLVPPGALLTIFGVTAIVLRLSHSEDRK